MVPASVDFESRYLIRYTRYMVDESDRLEFGFDISDPAYMPIFTRKQTLAKFAATGGTVWLAVFNHQVIVGYAVIGDPLPNSRWANACGNVFLELHAVEVARQFRHQGIAAELLARLFSGSAFEDHIVILSAYAWLWDLSHTGLSCEGYRKMLMSLYGGFGFESYPTNDPNVCLKPENIFMARIGNNLSSKDLERFKWLRFGITSPVEP